MKIKLTLVLIVILCAAVFAADKSAKIEAIKFRHKLNCELSINGIKAGFVACQLGWQLSNYIAVVEIELDKVLSNHIAEASKDL